MPINVAIIDYGMGNLRSVQKKFERIGANAIITNNPTDIEKFDKIVLPGVGHFYQGVQNLKSTGFWDVLNEQVKIKEKGFLGICLGMQLMCNSSEEGNTAGLSWIDAEVIKFTIDDTIRFKVPHMGWNSINIQQDSTVLKDINQHSLFYFVHSYHVICDNKSLVLTTTDFEYQFVSSVVKDNIFGVQFHPEKSHDIGEKLLINFLSI